MEKQIDTDKLRQDLIDYYGTAMFNASPLAIMDLTKVEKATDEELINIAIRNNIDLKEYLYNNRSRY